MAIIRVSIFLKCICLSYMVGYIYKSSLATFQEFNRIDIAVIVGLCGILINFICDDIHYIAEPEEE